MSNIITLEPAEIENLLKREVVSKGCKACLPSKLPNKWLKFFLDMVDEDGFPAFPNTDAERKTFGVMTLLLCSILEKQGRLDFSSPEQYQAAMRVCMVDYVQELIIEYGFRENDLFYERATSKNILHARSFVKTLKIFNKSAKYMEFYRQILDGTLRKIA